MYEEIVAAAKRSTEAAVQESDERVQLAVGKSEAADKKAAEASKAVGERWTNRINAMRRRAAERTGPGGEKSTEMRFGHEDGPHPNDQVEGDELVSLSDAPAAAQDDRTPAFGLPEQEIQQQVAATYGRHASDPAAARFYPDPAEAEEPVAFQPPPARRQPPPTPRRARRTDDEDDDYSGQSWLQG
jgi:hypothetical protein